MTKEEIFIEVQQYLEEQGYIYESKDDSRPWGGFFTIKEQDALRFADQYFSWKPDAEKKISPKFLIVAPGARLSWQYHHRRAERWKLISGDAFIVRSMTDEEQQALKMVIGENLTLQQGERHRLIGGDIWGVVAEIWIHTDSSMPSDENDIIRINDDYGR